VRPPSSDIDEILERSEPHLRTLAGARLLVTGAGGFLPAYFCEALVAANDRLLKDPVSLRCVDNFVTGLPERLAGFAGRPDVALENASVVDLATLGASHVVHGASIASPPAYRARPLETLEVNVLGTWRMLELARERPGSRVLHLSTSEVYGDPDPSAVPTPEDYVGRVSFTGPRACYDESKRLSETLCSLYSEVHGVNVVVARPFNVYGPTLRLDDGRVVPDLVRQALGGGPLLLHSDGTPTRSFCYVTDAVSAILTLLVSGERGRAYNVGNPEEVSMADLAVRIGRRFGIHDVRYERSADPQYLTDNPQRRCPDITRIRKLGWEPRVLLDEGIARLAEYHVGVTSQQ
jgi:dTDP-glucose 4,6-dehydratase/UDP-glucuronate decarboxylase